MANNYELSNLYTNVNSQNNADNQNDLFGTIRIPKIDLYYPIFSYLNDELLKIAPCKFYGDNLDSYGNLCIAGHNYDNNALFSNIYKLNFNDEIYIYLADNKEYVYTVIDNYEVDNNDLSPIFNYNTDEKLLTLVTCNNINDKRIIIKAIQKDL